MLKFLHNSIFKQNNGFTLAEVLITLGIIGIVASLTLPSLVNKYRIKQLETGFKRTSSLVQTALNTTAVEFGVGNFKEFNDICGNLPESQTNKCVNENKDYFQKINDDFLSRFNKLKKTSQYHFNYNGVKVYPFSGDKSDITYYGNLHGLSTQYSNGLYYLPDGSAITGLQFYHHGKYDGISLTFDTNGPQKGPNRYGYDIFLYNTGTWYKVCSKTTSAIPTGTSRGCYDYALKDVNPSDRMKSYWKSLY